MKYRILRKTPLVILGAVVIYTSFSFKSDFFEIAKQIEIFTTVFKEINMNYVDETSPADLSTRAIKSMLSELDPYTNFWSEQDVQNSRIISEGEYTGIGAALRPVQDGLVITEIYKDYPADKAGLKPGDKIFKIGETSITGFSENARSLLNGAINTEVDITYERQGQLRQASLKRSSVELKAVPFFKLINNTTGYIVLSRFNQKAYEETSRAVKDLKKQGAERLILDLRGNPGGLLSEAINISNIFLEKGLLITSTKSVVKKYNKEYHTQLQPIDTEIPLVVLVDGQSASASEIVSGAIQDMDRGVILGSRTFGKGLVQRPKEIAYGTQLKITISRYYTPSGRCIQALDYRKHDKNGNVVRTKAEDYRAFQTKNGRTVYDSGGILPDISLESDQYGQLTRALIDSNAIFDFATQFYYEHPLSNPVAFEFSDKDFGEFKSYLKKSNFEYKTQTEKKLEEMLITSEKEGYEHKIINAYKQIALTIENEKTKELEENKEEIKKVLNDEIIRRYSYEQGLYENHIAHNNAIAAAVALLNNPEKYNKILKN